MPQHLPALTAPSVRDLLASARSTLSSTLVWVARRFTPIRRAFGESPLTTGLILAFLFLLGLLLVRPMVMSLTSYARTDSLFAERSGEVAALRKHNDQLATTLDYYRTEAFVAERAREYGFVRPGEVPYVMREYAHPESAGTYTRNKVQNRVFGGPSSE